MEAIAEFNNGKTGTEEDFEYYISNYYSKKTALEMKRRRKVTGGCRCINRVLMFYLLNHYAYNLNEKPARKEACQLLLKAKATLPAYVGNKIKPEEKNY